VNAYLDELLAYVGLGDRDRELLRALHPVLAPSFPDIAARFYRAVAASPGAAAVLAGPAQVERLRLTLIDWMSTGLLGPYDERFYDKRSRIGRRHVAIGLPPHYMFGAMNVVRTAYLDRVVALLPPDEACARVAAIGKLLDVELAIMTRHYQLDSEERRVAQERRNLSDRLAAIQTMGAGFAHEIRNPINAAQLQLELLERRLRRRGAEPDLLEPTALAQEEMKRLAALLDDFLEFARPPDLDLQDHDIASIVRQGTERERPAAERRGAELAIEAEPLIAEVDAAKLTQVVSNLVRNGIEAVVAGGRVWVALVPGPERFVICVGDDGPGIPDHVRPRIYEPFFSTKDSGTGLGMSIVHSLVAMHGGTIVLDTGPAGTRFDVAIPRRRRGDRHGACTITPS
jgi:two-component system sensor histidine kinase HydH